MIEFYPEIKLVHIASVLASVGLFVVRAAGLLAGQRWPRALAVRGLSWSIDTVLLTAALMLVAILPAALFANQWLTVKLVALVLYIGLGHRALAASTPNAARLVWAVAALASFAYMVGVARAHHPLGPLVGLLP